MVINNFSMIYYFIAWICFVTPLAASNSDPELGEPSDATIAIQELQTELENVDNEIETINRKITDSFYDIVGNAFIGLSVAGLVATGVTFFLVCPEPYCSSDSYELRNTPGTCYNGQYLYDCISQVCFNHETGDTLETNSRFSPECGNRVLIATIGEAVLLVTGLGMKYCERLYDRCRLRWLKWRKIDLEGRLAQARSESGNN